MNDTPLDCLVIGAGPALLQRMAEQACKYGAPIVPGTVTHLEREAGGMFVVSMDGERVSARTVLMATGVVDTEPELPDVPQAVHRGLMILERQIKFKLKRKRIRANPGGMHGNGISKSHRHHPRKQPRGRGGGAQGRRSDRDRHHPRQGLR